MYTDGAVLALARAINLARAGGCLNVHDIVLRLHSEGYTVANLERPLFKKLLEALIEKAPNPMPKGPKGEKPPADVIGAAILVGPIATGEAEDKPRKTPNRARGGKADGVARAKTVTAKRRKEFAKKRVLA